VKYPHLPASDAAYLDMGQAPSGVQSAKNVAGSTAHIFEAICLRRARRSCVGTRPQASQAAAVPPNTTQNASPGLFILIPMFEVVEGGIAVVAFAFAPRRVDALIESGVEEASNLAGIVGCELCVADVGP
jgi:hypothetical protein